ncbi:enoyl-CoA hydratase/isomerase family protein [Xanthobacter autotrophicus]|uniref:enoyl-CoA hydratase/isomerase family protein n=1 Tax=Xanthobacter TaxID=279 RepID=UPI0024ABFC3A|nr:enoyl-CoA hydratase/isomerase family protein [Xanthobacter autotrophicus]MDI4663575.1 enoyl-CoA hydratase/isomerase family protein [Xanthobacter autotrophicus]
MTDNIVVRTEVTDAIAVVTVDNPPVNALSHKVRAGLLGAIRAAEADPAVEAVVLRCAGRTFIAGADISEFDKPPLEPALPDVLRAIAALRKPVIAAIHGSALGGGFEVALAAHFRVALTSAKMGLPEIRLGLIPGAGGTQRLPRLIGVEPALRLLLSGTPVEASQAHAMGAIDRVVETDDLLGAALGFARTLRREGHAAVPCGGRPSALGDRERNRAVIADLCAELERAQGDQIAWRHLINAVETGMEHGLDAGLAVERAAFLALRDSPQAKALREAFFAARRKAPQG